MSPLPILRSALLAFLCLVGASSAAHAEYVKLTTDFTIHYQQAGQGPQTIIYIPGWTASSDIFERQLKHYEGSKHYRAISYDPRGQGLTSKTLGGHTYAQHGRDLAAFIDKLGLKNVVLVGWSYGVFEMMAYVNQFGTSNLKAVVVLDGTPRAMGKDNTKEWIWVSQDDNDKFRETFTLQTLEDRPAASEAFARWMLESPTPENLRWVDSITSQTPDFIAALTNETGTYVNYEKDLKVLSGKLPLFFVMREEWGQRVTAWAKANTPGAEVVVMGKHMMFWERSDQFNKALDRFLAGLQ